MRSLSEEELLELVTQETMTMLARECEFPLLSTGPGLLSLISCLQLSLRHPANNGVAATFARDLIAQVHAMFLREGYPAYAEMIARGNVAAHDAPRAQEEPIQ